jgi:hypothetical protein
MRNTSFGLRSIFALSTTLALGCGDGAGTTPGTINATIWGEEYIEQGIEPALSPDGEGFLDGWTVRFTRFLVNAGGLTVASSDGTVGGTLSALRVYDLQKTTGPLSIGDLRNVAARRFDRVSYRMAPTTADAVAGNASNADVTLMRMGNYTLYAEGEARRMGTTLRFRWGFGGTVNYTQCQSSETEVGLAVPSGGTVRAQLTFHGDHLFYDDLQSPKARLRFDLIAGADADRDGEVTLDELARVDLTRAPMGQYGVGSRSEVQNLRQFVTALVATVGHFNGEGHCDERRQ